MHDFSTSLDALLTQGDNLLVTVEVKQESLVTKLDYLSMAFEDKQALKEPVEIMKNKVRSVFSPYKGKFRERRNKNSHHLSYLFSSEAAPPPATVPAPTTTMVAHQRKDYSYLRPGTLSSECTRRELSKFSAKCQIWLKKSLSADDRADTRLVWASIRGVLDDDWTEVLSRDENIAKKEFDDIYKMMDKIYLE